MTWLAAKKMLRFWKMLTDWQFDDLTVHSGWTAVAAATLLFTRKLQQEPKKYPNTWDSFLEQQTK